MIAAAFAYAWRLASALFRSTISMLHLSSGQHFTFCFSENHSVDDDSVAEIIYLRLEGLVLKKIF
jgi:hypothetical protein